MSTYPLTIAAPDGNVFQGEAVCLNLRGTEGDLAVMAGHVPFITAVKAGAVTIELPDDTVRAGHLDGGILTVAAEGVTLLAGSFQFDA
ncbi:MAG: hypothetical protein E7541_02780 [Ruminococcaceae bacterium]|nr:hypothetical protein [Oscillospiraceae bacterium]